MKTLPIALMIVLSCSFAQIAAQSTPPASPQPPSPNAKPTPSVAGKWTLTVDIQSPDSISTLTIALDGSRVSGTIVGTNTFAIAGQYVGGKLTFSMDYNGQATVHFAGAVKDDDTMEGTMDYGEGPYAWSATRLKD